MSPANAPSPASSVFRADQSVKLALRKLEAAEALGLSDESFDRYVKPHVRCVRLGSLRLYPIAELQRFLESQASAPLEGFE